jgi:hypothetical protein
MTDQSKYDASRMAAFLVRPEVAERYAEDEAYRRMCDRTIFLSPEDVHYSQSVESVENKG